MPGSKTRFWRAGFWAERNRTGLFNPPKPSDDALIGTRASVRVTLSAPLVRTFPEVGKPGQLR